MIRDAGQLVIGLTVIILSIVMLIAGADLPNWGYLLLGVCGAYLTRDALRE